MRTISPAPWGAPGLVFGATDAPYSRARPHRGQDHQWRRADPNGSRRVVSPVSGVVTAAFRDDGWHDGWGNYVDITVPTTNGIDVFARLAHHSDVYVRVGALITAGADVGFMGDTGDTDGVHLHEELWIDGVRVDPVYYRSHDIPGTPATAGGDARPFTPDLSEEDDMYDDVAQRALFAKIEAESRPYRTYQLGSGLILMGPGGATWTIPSGAYQGLLIAWGLTSATVQRVIDANELAALRSIHAALSPDPRDAQVGAILSLSDADVARIAGAIPEPVVTLTTAQLQRVADAAREGGADAVKGLSFVVTAA